SHPHRLTLRLAVGGHPVLGDLDDGPASPDGFNRATVSHNAVVVDGLNQRETPDLARVPAPGSDILFFAADPDFQVATFEDRHAYPRSTTRYRQTVLAVAGAKACYAVSVFEVYGGLQHDQLFHAPAGSPACWRVSVPLVPGPPSLLPPSIPFVRSARAEEGRWFVQSFGAFSNLSQGRLDRPAQAILAAPGAPGVKLHLLNNAPMTAFAGTSPDPSSPSEESGRSALVLRRRSGDGETLKTVFVTLFEPIGAAPPLKGVGRVESPADTVVLVVQTTEGTEHIVVNLRPGTRQSLRLPDGRPLRTDGLAVREAPGPGGLTLAGGSFADTDDRVVRQSRASGTIRAVARHNAAESRGWFETEAPLSDPASLAGRIVLIRHGDGTTRGWTLVRAENTPEGRARLLVREEPGFLIDPDSQEAHYYQFPRSKLPGPHRFWIAKIAR
ncbi:MAG: hypothetical protein IRY99_05615, partial [Isosphaeraceae bacterium]|nr:hypothetical protein [Isosphaeraceae bacterium]